MRRHLKKTRFIAVQVAAIICAANLQAQNVRPELASETYFYVEGSSKTLADYEEGKLYPSESRPFRKTRDNRKVWRIFDIEGNDYFVAEFKNSANDAGIWMTQNLRTKTYPDGTPIDPEHIGYPGLGASTEPYLRWEKDYGMLYAWNAAAYKKSPIMEDQRWAKDDEDCMLNPFTTPYTSYEVEVLSETSQGAHDGKIQGVCPKGWHLPSDREVSQLVYVVRQAPQHFGVSSYLGDTYFYPSGTIDNPTKNNMIGTVLKSPTHLADQGSGNSQGISDSSLSGGFNAILGGHAFKNNTSSWGVNVHLWTSSSLYDTHAWFRAFVRHSGLVLQGDDTINYLYTVRCKKD